MDSSPAITPTPTGAVATNTQHSITFLGNLNSGAAGGAVTLIGSGGERLNTQILGLSYFDPVGGKSVWIGEVQDSQGELLPSQREALYPAAFSGDVVGDVLYINSISGLEQLVLIRTQLPPPGDWGLDPASTMLQVITEFGSATPTPQITQITSDGSDADNFLDFGSIQMGQGFAFALGDETNKVRVTKHWAVLSGRTCLIEQVPFSEVAPLLQDLPPAPPTTGSVESSTNSIIHRVASTIILPERKLARKASTALKVSKPLDTKAFAMDFSTLTSSTNWVFTADSTTYVSGLCSLFGSNVWEGGCVLKFATNASILLNPAFGTTPTTSFRGSIYRPIIMTAKDDNSCGQTISGSTGSPSGYYASPALNIASLATQNMIGMRFCYAKQAISIAGNSANIYHSQFANCQSGLFLGGGIVHLRNALFANVVTNIILNGGMTVTVENGTLSGSSYLATGPSTSGGSLSLVNCILANVTNLSAGVFTLSGDYNGFYQTTTFGTHLSTTNVSPFHTTGAGNFYLTVGNNFRNAGTTNIDSTLLNDLTNRTTFPPNVVWSTQITTNMLLSPQIQRDNSPTTRDLGWHYDAIDWAVGDCWMFSTNSITATPGTVIGGFGTNYSFGIAQGALVIFVGTPNSPVRLVAFNTVQEQPASAWKEVTSGYGLITDYFGLAASRGLNFRFTDFSSLAQDEVFVYAGTVPGNFQDCQFHGGLLWGEPLVLNLTNCLFERVYAVMFTTDTNLPTVRNNTFFGGTLGYAPNNTNGVVRDNLFDHTSFYFNPVYCYLNFNAYVTNCDRLQPYSATDIILPASPAYQAGPLENFYLLSGSSLINADTTVTADAYGLFHYTVTTNLVNSLQIKETNSLLDIGFHAVAVDSNGVPIDTDTGGAPDYLENVSGDGSTNHAGETNWKNGSDDYNYLLIPQYLRCEYRQNPRGITTTYGQPRFYWTVSSPARADKQVAYQVIVGSSSNNVAGGYGDVWDSGKQYSDQTIQIQYSGSQLQSGQQLWWSVRAWDLYTGLSKWATNGAMFQVGLLSANEWNGTQWIGSTNYAPGQPCPMFRKMFLLTNQIAGATAYVSAKGAYELWINGQRVGTNVLAPEWTDYNKRIQYQTYDVTPYITNSASTSNKVVGAVVGEGWFTAASEFFQWEIGQGAYGNPDPQFLMLLVITNSDNHSISNIITDASWTCFTNGPIRFASILNGETNDATQEGFTTNWSCPSFTNSAVFLAGATTHTNVVATNMFSQPNEPMQITQFISPLGMWTSTNEFGQTATIYDLGQNIAGWCNLTLINTNGTNAIGWKVRLRHAEVLNLDSSNNKPNGPSSTGIYTKNLYNASQSDTYILNGDATQQFHPHFTYHGFRFVEVTAPASIASTLTTNSITGCVISSGVPFTGGFACIDTNFNNPNAIATLTNNPIAKLMTNAFWTLRGNLKGVFTACTQRYERHGYLFDEHIFSQNACFDVDMAAFLTKWIRDIRDSQDRRSDGSYPVYAPYANFSTIDGQVPEYADPGCQSGGLVFPWRLYQNYADTRMLTEHYNSAQKWFGYLAHNCTNSDGSWKTTTWGTNTASGQIEPQVVDWMEGDHFLFLGTGPSDWYRTAPAASTSYETWGTVWSAYSADILASMSQVLQAQALASGDTADANAYGANYTYYTNMASAARNAYNSSLVTHDGSGNITGFYSPSLLWHSTSQGDCLSALYYNMIPETNRPYLLTNLLVNGTYGISNYNNACTGSSKCDHHLSTGYAFTVRGMLEATRDGIVTNAYQLVTTLGFPSWLYGVTNGFTTCWEGWNTYVSGNVLNGGGYNVDTWLGSFNHLSFGAVGEWIWKVIGGINPDDSNPGFKNVIIKPEPGGGITNGFASFNSIHGPIVSAWSVAGTTYTLNVTNPANITASIYVPTTNLANITENAVTNGTPATSAAGVISYYTTNYQNFKNGATVFQVGSGAYSFKATGVSF